MNVHVDGRQESPGLEELRYVGLRHIADNPDELKLALTISALEISSPGWCSFGLRGVG